MNIPLSVWASKTPTAIPANNPIAMPLTTYLGKNLSSLSSSCNAAIGGVSGVALWALQEDDKEDKFFPKYVVRGMAIGLFAGMAVGVFEAQTDSGMFMSNGVPKGLFHLDMNSHSLALSPTKIIPHPDYESTFESPQWNLDLLTASF
jgi:hypothetical protein